MQFSLQDDGQIFYQEKPGNPLPGVPVARLKKGEAALAPVVESNDPKIQEWLNAHISTVLEPLVALKNDATLTGAVATIAAKVYEGLGIVPRDAIEDEIAKLDEESRRTLRAKKIRLGPILVFQPDLNKPAAVRLRAVLWSLFNDKTLPAPTPKDGVVSYAVDETKADKAFYQAVGYPVYGGRAIRIDMLDRVINAVYEGAKGGKFQAKHQMAEWLGSSIDGLYAVLEAMGHKKIEEEKPAEESVATDVPKDPNVKPELAYFYLKKGKANKAKAEKPRAEKPKKEFKKPAKSKDKKDFKKEPRVISAQAKVIEDSPFAILGQLKK